VASPPQAASTHGTAAQHSILLAITNVVDCCVLRCCHPSSWTTTTIIIVISILHLLASSFAPLLSCVPPPPSPIFRCSHRCRHRLRLPPTSNVFCLIVVCCWLSSLFVLVLSPFSSSRSSPVLAPHSSALATVFLSSLLLLSRLFDCCMHSRRIRRTLFLLHRCITNVQSGHCRRRHHRRRHPGRRGSGVHSAGNGHRLHRRLRCCRLCSRTAAGDGRPPRCSRPHPLLLLLRRGRPDLLLFGGVTDPPLKNRVHSSLSERFIVMWAGQTESDVIDVVISSRIVVVVIASPPSPPRSAASSEPLLDNCRYIACLDSSWEGCVCEDSVLKRPRAMPMEK